MRPVKRVDPEAVKRFAAESTRVSAKLEDRVVPDGYVRPEAVERYLATRKQ